MSDMPALRATDPEIHRLIALEAKRQDEYIRLIPSENYASAAVMEATGSILNNKYSEGYPGKRYYEGQEYIDQVETLAIDRAKSLFGMQHANVQPYSGSPANQAVYLALAKPGDPVMGLGLPFGGHLTHGWGVNFSGIIYKSVQYEVDPETHRVDLNRASWRQTAADLLRRTAPRTWIRGLRADRSRRRRARRRHQPSRLTRCASAPYPHATIITTTTTRRCAPRGV
jgi:glycine/serine hydroxymethyltransferase